MKTEVCIGILIQSFGPDVANNLNMVVSQDGVLVPCLLKQAQGRNKSLSTCGETFNIS